MDLAKQTKIVDSIHDTLHDFVGQRLKFGPIWVGRKSSRAKGVLMQVHPQLFILEVDRKRGRTSRQSYPVRRRADGHGGAVPERRAAVRALRARVRRRRARRGSYGRARRGEGPVLTAQAGSGKPTGCRKRGTRFCVSGLVSSVVQRGQRIE